MPDDDRRDDCAPFYNFLFSTDSLTKQRLSLKAVMPINSGFSYAVILNDAYLGRDTPINGFEKLSAHLNINSPLEALSEARNLCLLTEGKKWLPAEILKFLTLTGGPECHMRFGSGKGLRCCAINPESLGVDIVASQGCYEGEFEICDKNGSWYLRFRDDEPVIFLAAEEKVIGELTEKFTNNILQVPSDFLYCY